MKTVFWIAAMLLVGLVGYLLHSFVEHRRQQVEFVNYEVGPEGIAAYRARADSLRATADSLHARLDRLGLVARRSVRAHITLLDDEIAALERTIEMWHKSIRTRSDVDLQRQVILLYGEASAAARALAADTMLEGER